MTEKILFRIWVIEIYLRFGAWDLVHIPMLYAPCHNYLSLYSPNTSLRVSEISPKVA